MFKYNRKEKKEKKKKGGCPRNVTTSGGENIQPTVLNRALERGCGEARRERTGTVCG